MVFPYCHCGLVISHGLFITHANMVFPYCYCGLVISHGLVIKIFEVNNILNHTFPYDNVHENKINFNKRNFETYETVVSERIHAGLVTKMALYKFLTS